MMHGERSSRPQSIPSAAEITRTVTRKLGIRPDSTDAELETTAAALHIMEPEVAADLARAWRTGQLIDVLTFFREEMKR